MTIPVLLALLTGCVSSEPEALVPTLESADKSVGKVQSRAAAAEFLEELEYLAEGADAEPMAGAPPAARSAPERPSAAPKPPPAGPADAAPSLRQWFPESFLWQPLVETNEAGVASLPVRVPDQLTSWRVLALAHSRDGQQAGTVHTFDSRLPLYVDPVVPSWMYSGDRLTMPIQVVNTTGDEVVAGLDVVASGSLAGAASSRVQLGAGGSALRKVAITASGAGAATVRATLEDADAIERAVRVVPKGRPVRSSRGGTLAGPRTFALPGAKGADPATEELQVVVFPGPLAVLQAEVERAGTGGAHPWDPAYTFALAAQLEDLGFRTGAEIDAKVVRELRILGWQRVVREARSPDAGRAADLLASMQGVEDDELAKELRERLIRTVVSGQRADGTWSRQSSGSLQLVLAQTAVAARVLPASEAGARLRAAGVIERHLDEVEDPYTAALWLASGVAEGTVAQALRERLVAAAVEDQVGAHGLTVPPGVLNPWGVRPSRQEMLAWGSLALAEDAPPWHGDLVADLMSRYDAAWGFGAGPADVVALDAVTRALPGISSPVDVTLALNGEVVGTAALDPSQPMRPVVLVAPTGGENPEVRLEAPGATGLAFVASVDSWVPWSGEEALEGVEVEVSSEDLAVGEQGRISLRVSAPAGVSLWLEQGLPAGAKVDEARTRQLSTGVRRLELAQDRVRFQTRPFSAGEVIELNLWVSPAFAGSFSTRPLQLTAEGQQVSLPPIRWEVSG